MGVEMDSKWIRANTLSRDFAGAREISHRIACSHSFVIAEMQNNSYIFQIVHQNYRVLFKHFFNDYETSMERCDSPLPAGSMRVKT